MLYGTPPRREHRVSSGGALAVLVRGSVFVRGFGGTGQHRSPARTRRRQPREALRTAQLLTRGLAALILLGLVGTTAFFVASGQRRDDPGTDGGDSVIDAGLLASRAVDADPLTIAEVFPDRGRVVPPAAQPYQITMTHTDADCRTATTGALGTILAGYGCSQVVRAAMTTPYGDYKVTAGLFNLADANGAAEVDGQLRHLVETGDGSFATLPAGRTDPDALPTSQVGWRSRGHYLLYCVITRADGQLVTSDDPYAEKITGDLVDSYFGVTVLGRRAAG